MGSRPFLIPFSERVYIYISGFCPFVRVSGEVVKLEPAGRFFSLSVSEFVSGIGCCIMYQVCRSNTSKNCTVLTFSHSVSERIVPHPSGDGC